MVADEFLEQTGVRFRSRFASAKAGMGRLLDAPFYAGVDARCWGKWCWFLPLLVVPRIQSRRLLPGLLRFAEVSLLCVGNAEIVVCVDHVWIEL